MAEAMPEEVPVVQQPKKLHNLDAQNVCKYLFVYYLTILEQGRNSSTPCAGCWQQWNCSPVDET